MKGLTRGLQLIASLLRYLLHAVEKGNDAATTEALTIVRQWLHETTDEFGAVIINPTSLLFGADPWKVSRQMFQKYDEEWKGKL